jgi:hypothetical protein
MSYQVKAVNLSSGALKTTAGNIQWTAGFANPRLVKFEATQGTSQIEYKSTNTAQIDLMAAAATGFGNFTIPSGTYNEIELKIQLDKNGSSPALQLSGQFSNGTVTIPVQLQVNDFVEIKTEQKNVTVTDSTLLNAITNIDLSSFTTGINETMLLAAQLTGGTLVISSGSNKNLYDIILNNFRNRRHHCEFESHHK